MALGGDRITFWFGCNMLRHAEMIRLSIMLLERVGYDVNAAGGPAYCCGTAHDHQPQGASNMSARTIGRFNEAAEKDGRTTVVTWCPSCHMHMSDIMAPGNSANSLALGAGFDPGGLKTVQPVPETNLLRAGQAQARELKLQPVRPGGDLQRRRGPGRIGGAGRGPDQALIESHLLEGSGVEWRQREASMASAWHLCALCRADPA